MPFRFYIWIKFGALGIWARLCYTRFMKRFLRYAAPLAALGILLALGLDNRLTVTAYILPMNGIVKPVRLALISDLHSCDYGKEQIELQTALKAAAPDAVMLAGDILDDRLPGNNTWPFLAWLGKQYPAFYVTGNHEYWARRAGTWKKKIASLAITVPEGETVPLWINGQKLLVAGLGDPEGGERLFLRQIEMVALDREEGVPSILLSHRPDRLTPYRMSGYALILSGHTHGGQWRIPVIDLPVFTPDGGFFPALAGGMFKVSDTQTMVVSRGLSRESTRIPRLFNRPEIVLIDLVPEGSA